MDAPSFDAPSNTNACCSQRLLGAALAGLLCLASAGCSSNDDSKHGNSEAPKITSSQLIADMTAEEFKARCDARGGTVEIMPHCGGFASAKGFSYDSTTDELSEHTCMGANTCAGWNCAIVD